MHITCCPCCSYLYYLESVQGITRLTLGNDRQNITVASLLRGGSALAVDITTDKLFVCDGLHQITSMKLDGSSQQTIGLGDKNCSSIVAFDSKVYYSIIG